MPETFALFPGHGPVDNLQSSRHSPNTVIHYYARDLAKNDRKPW